MEILTEAFPPELMELYLKLKDSGILVRYFKKLGIDNFIRITIGTEKEMEIFEEKIKEILKQSK